MRKIQAVESHEQLGLAIHPKNTTTTKARGCNNHARTSRHPVRNVGREWTAFSLADDPGPRRRELAPPPVDAPAVRSRLTGRCGEAVAEAAPGDNVDADADAARNEAPAPAPAPPPAAAVRGPRRELPPGDRPGMCTGLRARTPLDGLWRRILARLFPLVSL